PSGPHGHRHEPRAATPVVFRTEPEIAPPLGRSKPCRSESTIKFGFRPDAKGRLVETNIDPSAFLDDGQEARLMNFLAAFLFVEGENRNPSAIRGLVVHHGPRVLWMADPRIEVRQVEDQQSPAPQMAAEDGECPSDIRWGCDVVEGRPEAEQGRRISGSGGGSAYPLRRDPRSVRPPSTRRGRRGACPWIDPDPPPRTRASPTGGPTRSCHMRHRGPHGWGRTAGRDVGGTGRLLRFAIDRTIGRNTARPPDTSDRGRSPVHFPRTARAMTSRWISDVPS